MNKTHNNITKNPLQSLGYETDDIIPKGGYGAVFARAGVGKTSFLVQMALNYMLRGKKVLHISLDDPIKKITLWYKEVFHNLSIHHNLENGHDYYESILPFRFIMTLRVDGFNIPRLEERLDDLISQDVFTPDIMIIDGFSFDASDRATLLDLKSLAEKLSLHVWFSVKTHRHIAPGPDGLPEALTNLDDLFHTIIELRPDGKEIQVTGLKGGNADTDTPKLIMDPTTMLIVNG